MRLIACGKKKRSGEHPAADLYTGTMFKTLKMWAEQSPDGNWGIMSAKYGFLEPSDVVSSYDKKLSKAGVEDWAKRVVSELPKAASYELVGPDLYTKAVYNQLQGNCTIVAAGLSQGLKIREVRKVTDLSGTEFTISSMDNPVLFAHSLYDKLYSRGLPLTPPKNYTSLAVKEGVNKVTASRQFGEWRKKKGLF